MPLTRMTRAAGAVIGAGCVTVTVLGGGAALARGHHAHRTDPAAHQQPAAPAPASDPIAVAPANPPASLTRQQAAAPVPVTQPAAVHVPPLRHLTQPDAVVSLRHTASAHVVQKLRRLTGVHAVAVLDRGTIRVHHQRLRVAGVPLADIRGFTPKVTAVSKPLWRSVARGELTVGFSSARKLRHRLGATLTAHGAAGIRTPLRIGAFATLDLGSTQAIVSHQRAASLGLTPARRVLVAAPRISLDELRSDITRTLGHAARVHITRPVPVNQTVISSYGAATIPTSYLDLYRRAALTCPGLPWQVLAGIGTVETGNGRNVHRSTAGAEGPMQFLPSTWAMYGTDADGDGKADIQDPTDAVFSAARYLCAAGAGRGGHAIDDAIFSYNHAWWYVREVLVFANRYA